MTKYLALFFIRIQVILCIYLVFSGVTLIFNEVYHTYGLYMLWLALFMWIKDVSRTFLVFVSIPMMFFAIRLTEYCVEECNNITNITAVFALGLIYLLWLDEITKPRN